MASPYKKILTVKSTETVYYNPYGDDILYCDNEDAEVVDESEPMPLEDWELQEHFYDIWEREQQEISE